MKLQPMKGRALVKLTDALENVDIPDKQFATKTTGIVQAVENKVYNYLVGRKIYFGEYKESSKIETEEDTFTFIKLTDIDGYLDD